MTNAEISRILHEVADLLEIRGADSFRVSSYRRAGRSIDDLSSELTQLVADGDLSNLPGIGKSMASKLRELLDTGKLAQREELLREIPAGTLELLKIPGMGPKKVALLFHELGVDSLDSLRSAIDSGSVATLKGFGEKSVEKILSGMAFLARSGHRTRLGQAWPVAETFREQIARLPGVERVEHAGSLRRGCETVGDLDLLCIARDGPAIVEKFSQLPGVTQVLASGGTKGSVLVEWATDRTIQIDLRVVPAESFGAAWQYFTGSKEHNVRLREMAVKRGWSLNEYSLSEGEKIIAARSEEEIYQALALPWIPPELREDRGEFSLTETPADLLTEADVRGELHLHTTASDGRHTIEEMAMAAKARGYEYICVTDHSQSSVVANGLKPDRLKKHIAAIRKADAAVSGITILAGAEVDIHADGTLDYEDDLLAQLDWVVASNHQHMGPDGTLNTRRALAAIHNPYVNLLAHPTGRVLNRRDAMPLDLEKLCAAARETGTALEINAALFRLDLSDKHARAAGEAGVTIAVNTDAHGINDFAQIRYGVLTARRAWLRREQVLNTWPLERVRRFVAAKRNADRKREAK